MAPYSLLATDGGRKSICHDTMRRSAAVSAETPGASTESIFIKLAELPPLSTTDSSFPNLYQRPVRICGGDTLAITRQMMQANPSTEGKVAVLNLASDRRPADDWNRKPWKTQEDALCYSSTLFATLKPSYYANNKWPNLGPGSASGIFSPAVTIFRHDQEHNFAYLASQERKVVSIISIGAPRFVKNQHPFNNPSHTRDLQEKIRLIYRLAAHKGKTFLVLGAMGCGAYNCPPTKIASEMRSILEEKEFEGWFQEIVFAIYGRGNNYNAFTEEFVTSDGRNSNGQFANQPCEQQVNFSGRRKMAT